MIMAERKSENMASTFFGLTIAYSGLQAANTSLTITGHNVSNINTKGYTRQQQVHRQRML